MADTQPSPQTAEWLSRRAADDHRRGIRQGMSCHGLLIGLAEQMDTLSIQMQEMRAALLAIKAEAALAQADTASPLRRAI